MREALGTKWFIDGKGFGSLQSEFIPGWLVPPTSAATEAMTPKVTLQCVQRTAPFVFKYTMFMSQKTVKVTMGLGLGRALGRGGGQLF